MFSRYLKHIGFWVAFISLYALSNVLFASPTDALYSFPIRYARYLISELIFLPWKAIPFYALFYFILPSYILQGHRLKGILLFSGITVICILGYRSMIIPANHLLYNEAVPFNVYDLRRLLYTLTDIIPAFGIASAIKLMGDAIVSRKKAKSLRKEKVEMELKYLKAQSNPHFLFNTFNNLYGLARKDNSKTAEYILTFANLMRSILEACENDFIKLSQELNLIESYIALEQIRFSDRLKVEYHHEVKDQKIQIAPLILMGFIENSFKHVANNTRSESFIKIQVFASKSQLNFSIKNSSETTNIQKFKSRGLPNLRRQLHLIYLDRHQLKITNEEGIFTASLSIKFSV